MNKLMTIGMTAVMAAGIAGAQDDVVMVGQAPMTEATDATEVTGEIALVSSYVWRGQVLNNDFVIQPQITASYKNFSVNVWGNYDIGHNYAGNSSDFSEMDISLAYTIPLNLNDVSFDVGLINYNFPNTTDTSGAAVGATPSAAKSTTELFASATILTLADYVIPSVTFFGDIDQANGTYILFDIVAPYQVSEYLSVEGGFSAGYGNTSYNDYYWGYDNTGVAGNPTLSKEAGFNDYNFYGNASYEIAENLTASVNVTYTMLEGGEIRSAAKKRYEDNQKFWGGVNLAYDF